MPEPDDFTMIYDGKDMYLAADGVKIAKRSKGNTWISLEPGWRVLDGSDSITNRVHCPRLERLRQLIAANTARPALHNTLRSQCPVMRHYGADSG
jgi:hypothetical protein